MSLIEAKSVWKSTDFLITWLTTYYHTLSLHDALPIYVADLGDDDRAQHRPDPGQLLDRAVGVVPGQQVGGHLLQHGEDRKSTRLNSSHSSISYAVFCLKKKKHLRLNPKRQKPE